MKTRTTLGIGALAAFGAAALMFSGCIGQRGQVGAPAGKCAGTCGDSGACAGGTCPGGVCAGNAAKCAERLAKIEERLSAVEARLAQGPAAATVAAPVPAAMAAAPGAVPMIGVANGSKDTWKCVKVEAVPAIDGKLDDAAWKSAVQSQLVAEGGGRLANDGSVLLCHDGTNLYVAAVCMESDMDKLKADCTKRDDKIYGDDCVEFYFDKALARQSAVKLVVNAEGVFMDFTRLLRGDGDDVTWSPVIKTARLADRWVIEMAVPLKDIGLEYKPGAAIGFNALRMRQKAGGRSFEASTWWGRVNKVDSLGKVVFE